MLITQLASLEPILTHLNISPDLLSFILSLISNMSKTLSAFSTFLYNF